MSGHIQHIINTAHDPEVIVFIPLRAIARQVVALELGREIALLEALRITPDGAYHGGPWTLDDQETALATLDLFSGLVDDSRRNARQGQSAGPRLRTEEHTAETQS